MYTPSAVGYFNITTTRVLFVHNSHTFCYVVCGGLAVAVGLSFLCGTLSFAVFYQASMFNQDVSKWNTGVVTNMNSSKCSLSLSLYMATPSAVVFLNIRQLEFHRITILTRWNGTFSLFVVGSFCCTLLSSCSVWLRICVQPGRVQLEYGGGDNYGKQ